MSDNTKKYNMDDKVYGDVTIKDLVLFKIATKLLYPIKSLSYGQSVNKNLTLDDVRKTLDANEAKLLYSEYGVMDSSVVNQIVTKFDKDTIYKTYEVLKDAEPVLQQYAEYFFNIYMYLMGMSAIQIQRKKVDDSVQSVNGHSVKKYEIPEDEESGWSMVAEDSPVYGRRDDDSKWINVQNSKKRPRINEQTLLCGFVYPGILETCIGNYCGDNEWETMFDENVNLPEFQVMYWQRIEVPENAVNESMEMTAKW